MENANDRNPQTVSLWITSLAISITCCAILFVIFAGYLGEIKKQIAVENEQLSTMAGHQQLLIQEIQSLQRSITNGQNPTAAVAPTVPLVVPPSPAVVVPPVAPTVAVPSTSSIPVPVGTTAPVVITPPSVAPTAIPEVPAKP